QTVTVSYTPSANALADAARNGVQAFSAHAVINSSASAPAPSPGSFAPSLAKPGFADDRSGVREPWVGEWGPKGDPYWLPSTGHLRGLVVPVDFSDAPSTRP